MNRRGFTLLELLVSMAIASVIMLALLSLMRNSSDTFNSASKNISQRVDGRSGIHMLRRDLAGQLGAREFFYEAGTLGTAWPCDEFGFFTAKTAENQGDPDALGDVCFVRYYVAENDVFSDGFSRKLYRQFIKSDDAKDVLKEGASAGAPPIDAAVDEVIAINVLQFTVTLWTRVDSTEEWVEWTEASTTDPMRADISMVIVEPLVAKRLNTSEDWDSSDRLGTPADPNAEVVTREYTTRILLK